MRRKLYEHREIDKEIITINGQTERKKRNETKRNEKEKEKEKKKQ